MLQDIHIPHSLSGRELDLYLAHGWYRMGPAIFTTRAITLEGAVFPVQWLRINLDRFSLRTGHRRLLKKNEKFKISIAPLDITSELEDLYARYYAAVNFEASPSVADFMLCGAPGSAFDSYLISLRHEGRLLAAGIYDQGEKSIAGIMNFYEPSIAQYSPGRYLMLLKTLVARDAGMRYYYPGYAAEGLPKFDYKKKLSPEATEYYEPKDMQWLSIADNR